jgi:hemerythrin superfamily protein
MDAIKLLKEDHKKVKALFEQVEGLGDRAATQRKNLFQKIDKELTLHSKIEETLFYPEFKKRAKNSEERDEVLEAYEEHGVVKVMIGELEDLDPKDEKYKPKLTVLKELVLHHVKEEEGELFPMARELFEPEELNRIGDRIVAAKEKAKA